MSSGQPLPYGYSWSSPLPQTGHVTTSRGEVVQITVAFAVLTLDLVLLLSGSDLLFGTNVSSVTYLVTPTIVAVAATAALTGFLAHEMAHKVVAQRRGYWAEFQWSPVGLLFSVFTAAFGFLFAAPGATRVGGMSDPREWGRTALAGPVINLVFGGMFYATAVVAWSAGASAFRWLLLLAFINSWFAVFNLIPFGVLDGAKVARWSWGIWAAVMTVAVAVGAVSWLSFFYYGTPFLHG